MGALGLFFQLPLVRRTAVVLSMASRHFHLAEFLVCLLVLLGRYIFLCYFLFVFLSFFLYLSLSFCRFVFFLHDDGVSSSSVFVEVSRNGCDV